MAIGGQLMIVVIDCCLQVCVVPLIIESWRDRQNQVN